MRILEGGEVARQDLDSIRVQAEEIEDHVLNLNQSMYQENRHLLDEKLATIFHKLNELYVEDYQYEQLSVAQQRRERTRKRGRPTIFVD